MPKLWIALAIGLCCVTSLPTVDAQQAANDHVLQGHRGSVSMGVFTPDGAQAVTASTDETARLWDLKTRAVQRQFLGHTGPLYCLSLSADGRTLVTGAQDNTLRVWDVPQTRPVLSLPGHEKSATDLAISPDGRTLATVGSDGRVRRWEATKLVESTAASTTQINPATVSQQLVGHEHPLRAVAIRNDNNLIATADDHGRIVFWSPYLDEPQGDVEGAPVSSLAFHSNNQQLFSAGVDGLVRVWQLPTPLPRVVTGITAPIQHFTVMSNQALAVVVTADQVPRLVNLDSSAIVREFAKSAKPITAIALSPNNAILAIAEMADRVVLLNVSNGEPIGAFRGHAGDIHDIAFHADNLQLFTTGDDGTVRHWRVPVAGVPLNGHTAASGVLTASHNGAWYATGSADKSVRMWQPNGQPLRALTNHQQPITAIAVRADDAQLATADAGGAILLWNAGNGAAEGTLTAGAEAVTALAYDRSDASLLSADMQGSIRRWTLPISPPVLATGHSQPVRSIATTPDGKLLVTGSQDQSVRVWNAVNGQAVRTLDAPGGLGAAISSVTISPNGTRVAAVSEAGQLAVWNLADGALQQRRTGTEGAMFDVGFLNSGMQVVTLEADQHVRLWQVPLAATENEADAMPYQAVKLPDANTKTLVVSADGKWLYASGASKIVRGWQLAGEKIANDNPQHTLSIAKGAITDLTCSRDGTRMAAASEDRNIYVWNATALAGAAGQNVPPLQTLAQSSPVRSVAISHDGARLAAAADDLLVHRWDLVSGQLAERLPGHTQPVRAISFIGSSERIASGGNDNVVRLSTPSVSQVIRAADNVASGPVTHLVSCAGEVSVAGLLKNGQSVLLWKRDGTSLPPLAAPASPLQSLRVSKDGTGVVAGSTNGRVLVWALANAKLTTIEASGSIADAAFSHAGTEVAVVNTTQRVRVYSLNPVQLVEEIPTTPAASRVIWSADDRQLAVTGATPAGSIVSRSLQALWSGAADKASVLAIAPNGASVFVGSADGKVRQLRTTDGEVERTLEGHQGAITRLVVSPNGQQLASVSVDKTLRVWSVADGALRHTMEHATPARDAAIAPNSLRIATIAEDGVVRTFDMATGLPLQQFSGHKPGVGRVRWLSDNASIASASIDKTLRIRKVSAVRSLRIHEQPIVDMALYAGGGQTLSCAANGRVLMSDATSGQVVREFQGGVGEPRAIASRADNQRVAVGTSDAKVFIWNATNAELLQTLVVDGPVRAVAWSPDNQKLAVSTETGNLYFFGRPLPPTPVQPTNELMQHQQTTTGSAVSRIVFDRNNRVVWATHDDGHVAQWAYAAPTQVRQFNHGGPVYGVAVSKDGKLIVSCSTDQTVRVWDATTGQQRFQMNGHAGAVHAVALSPNESFAVSAGADRTLRLWDVVGGRQLKQLATLDETMYSVAMHPNGQLVAAAGADRKVYVYNVITGALVKTLEGHPDYIHCVSFNRAGTRLLSYGYAGQLRLWEPNSGKLLFEDRIGRIGNYADYHADGSRLLLSNGDGTSRLFDLPAGAK